MEYIQNTKRQLEGLLAEFGQTLPSRFEWRLMKIGAPYTTIRKVDNIYYGCQAPIYREFEKIVFHSSREYSVEEIKKEMEELIEEFKIFSME